VRLSSVKPPGQRKGREQEENHPTRLLNAATQDAPQQPSPDHHPDSAGRQEPEGGADPDRGHVQCNAKPVTANRVLSPIFGQHDRPKGKCRGSTTALFAGIAALSFLCRTQPLGSEEGKQNRHGEGPLRAPSMPEDERQQSAKTNHPPVSL
jgi:hypothetical protein